MAIRINPINLLCWSRQGSGDQRRVNDALQIGMHHACIELEGRSRTTERVGFLWPVGPRSGDREVIY
jgi:hypothetical protein